MNDPQQDENVQSLNGQLDDQEEDVEMVEEDVESTTTAELEPTTEDETYDDIPGVTAPSEQLAWIQELRAEQPELKVGQTWYLLSADWLKKWKQFTAGGERPGPVDNTKLVDDPDADILTVSKSLMERFDYDIITLKEWKTWLQWYGGGPTIARKAIPFGWHGKPSIEIRPLHLLIVRSSDLSNVHHVFFSKATKVGELRKKMCEKLSISEDDVRLWDYHADRKIKLLTDPMTRLDDAQIIDNQKVLFEEKGPDGKFPKLTSGSQSSFYNEPTDPGKCGLMNLGNTCFMNSALQCLSNTAPLTKFFLTDNYKEDINADNPLGCKGELAEEYADLLKLMWGGTCRAVAPRDFKWKMERFAPQFSGYQQHDSQELLSFLLDGVNEDLNRIKKKGFVLKRDSAGRLDSEVAAEHWEGYKSRNDSRIVDLFQGQLKSKLTCPECGKVSITFDPFMYLSLPLPVKKTREIYVTIFPFDLERKPTRYRLSVKKAASIGELKKQLGEVGKVKAECLKVCDVYHHKFFKIFSDDEGVSKIQDRDFIHAYECDPRSLEEDFVSVAIYNEAEERARYMSTVHVRREIFGLPFFITVPNRTPIPKLYEVCKTRLAPLLKDPSTVTFSESDDLVDSDEEEEEEDLASTSAYGAAEDEEEEKEKSKAAGKAKKAEEGSGLDPDKKLFDFRAYETYSSSESEPFKDTDTLKLSENTKLTIHWNVKASKLYDKHAAQDVEQDASVTSDEAEKADGITINKCMELFTVPEKLDPQDAWYCNVCKKHQEATKKFDIWSAPDVLVIHLKRFSYRNQYMREKIETFVDFPLVGLDIAKHVLRHTSDKPLLYDCYAITNHFGSLAGGHYTAFAINPIDNKWYQFDDSHVSKADGAVKTSAAYVLFFRKRNLPDESVWDLSTCVSPPPAAEREEEEDDKGKKDDLSEAETSDGGEEMEDSDE